jgi:hypothetical protein
MISLPKETFVFFFQNRKPIFTDEHLPDHQAAAAQSLTDQNESRLQCRLH